MDVWEKKEGGLDVDNKPLPFFFPTSFLQVYNTLPPSTEPQAHRTTGSTRHRHARTGGGGPTGRASNVLQPFPTSLHIPSKATDSIGPLMADAVVVVDVRGKGPRGESWSR